MQKSVKLLCPSPHLFSFLFESAHSFLPPLLSHFITTINMSFGNEWKGKDFFDWVSLSRLKSIKGLLINSYIKFILIYISQEILSKFFQSYFYIKLSKTSKSINSSKNIILFKIIKSSEEWFRSIDLWVMSPARFHCATSLNFLFKFPINT